MESGTQTESDIAKGLERLSEYRGAIVQLFPALPKAIVEQWSITDVDAVAFSRFVDKYTRHKVVVLEIGSFVGVSAFYLASQPKVSEVIGVDINPLMVDELSAQADVLRTSVDYESLGNVRVLDIARSALARFPEQQQKVRFVAGTVEDVDLPVTESGASLVAFVDGAHTKEAVKADLQTIFEKNSHTVAVLHDVLYDHAHFVLSGVQAFIEASQTKYRFRRFAPLAAGHVRPNLGVLYPEAMVNQVEEAAAGLLPDPTAELLHLYGQTQRLRKRADNLKAQQSELKNQLNSLKAELQEARRPLRRLLRQRFS